MTMETYITNPKKRGTAKAKGGHRRRRRNPGPLPFPNKGKGRARRGMSRNPSGSGIIPGGAGGLLLRLVMRKAGGDKVRGTDGKLTGTGYGIGALACYFADDAAGWLGFHGSDAVAFKGGVAGVAASFLADEHLADFSRDHLYPMVGAPPPETATAGVAGLGATAARPMSRDAYLAMAGVGALSNLGPVVYVQLPDGSIHAVPTTAGAVSGPSDTTIDLPDDAHAGDIIRQKSTGKTYKLVLNSAGGIDAVPNGLAGGRDEYMAASLSGSRSEYLAAA